MAYKYETKNCKHCEHCVKTDNGLYCAYREGHPKVTGGGWCLDMKEKVNNNDMIPVGTTFHINPEDVKWEVSGDLISRSAVKEVINYNQMYVNPKLAVDDVIKLIDNAPAVDPDMEFAKWVTKMIFDSEVEDFDLELFSELACRKLEKLGLVEKTASEWVNKGGAE